MNNQRKWPRRLLWLGVVLLVVMSLPFCYLWLKGPDFGESLLVKVAPVEKAPITESARQLHRQLFIADLHADPLLWARDLSKRGKHGHVDVPRLLEGNVGLQVFGVVSQISPFHNSQSNPDADILGALAFAQRWPINTWFSIRNRGFYQAEKLRSVVRDSGGTFTLIKSKQDLLQLISRKVAGNKVVGGLLALEGVQTLEGSLQQYQEFYQVGYRMMGLVHFVDTEAAGSRHGVEKYGLTEFGKALIRAMEKDGVVLDLAHASAAATSEALTFAVKPVVISHTGVKGVCDRGRNLSDEHIRALAANGGVIGIGYWPSAVCGLTPRDVVKSIRYVADLVGVDYVGLGSDYDGAVTVGFDTSELALITQELLAQGFSHNEIMKIMGGNVVRVLLEVLPNAE